MEKKPLTQMEFFSIPDEDISKEDKELIEKAVLDTAGEYKDSPNIPVRCALRGYLAKMWLDVVPDGSLREDVSHIAAIFSDAWHWKEEVKDG